MKTLILVALLLCSCAGPSQAEQDTYSAVAPEYLQYVERDPALTEAQKISRRDTVETWRMRAFAGTVAR
jgi:hypothetical protein